MKRICLITMLALLVIGGIAPIAQAQSALTFKVYASTAPNRQTSDNSPAKNAYRLWQSRALDSVENGKGNIGSPSSDPAAFVIQHDIEPKPFLVTHGSAGTSWRGVADPTGDFASQYGNRIHFVLHVKGNGTARFKYEDISWEAWGDGVAIGGSTGKRTLSSSPPQGYVAAQEAVDGTAGWGYDWGADRAKGGGDDTKVFNSITTLVDELFFTGPGYALDATVLYQDANYPNTVDFTVQQWLHAYCDHFGNTNAKYKRIGKKFKIVDNANTTHSFTYSLTNYSFGRGLIANTCHYVPLPDATEEPAPQPTGAPTATAIQHTGPVLQAAGYNISAAHGLTSGVQFKKVEGAEIGVDWVLDLGVVDAIDVWGYAEQGVTVCFPQAEAIGGLLFLDASASPRTVTTLESFMRDGQVCATIYGEGTIVAVGGGAATPVPESAVANTTTLTNCMVKTLYELNFRETPGGALIGTGIPYNATLTALERTADWFKVDYHGVQGWISAQYVEKIGDCG